MKITETTDTPKAYYVLYFTFADDEYDEGAPVEDFGLKGSFHTREAAYKAMKKLLKGDLPDENIMGCRSVFTPDRDPDADPEWAEYYENMFPFEPFEVVDVLTKKEVIGEAFDSPKLAEAARPASSLLKRFHDEEWMDQIFIYLVDEYVDEHGSTGDEPKRYAQRRMTRFKNIKRRDDLYADFVAFGFLTSKELEDNKPMLDKLVTGWLISNGY
jgi:hypothetical protein